MNRTALVSVISLALAPAALSDKFLAIGGGLVNNMVNSCVKR